MADDNTIVAEARDSFGKGAARKLRANHKIPAVIYGHGGATAHVSLPGHETALLLRRANALIDLHVDGKKQLVLVKDVQRDPVLQLIEHIDLVVIRKGERVEVEVWVAVEGDPQPGMIVDLDTKYLHLSAEATHIPETVLINVEGLEEGTQILAGEVELPRGATLLTDPEALVVMISEPQKADLGDDDETGEDETDAAEPAGSGDSDEASE